MLRFSESHLSRLMRVGRHLAGCRMARPWPRFASELPRLPRKDGTVFSIRWVSEPRTVCRFMRPNSTRSSSTLRYTEYLPSRPLGGGTKKHHRASGSPPKFRSYVAMKIMWQNDQKTV